jgi:hypothetical protein
MQAQQAEAAALGESGTLMAHPQQRVQLEEVGMLTEEFAAGKAKLFAV